MPPDDKHDPAAPVSPSTHVDPPKIYIPACGVLCDIFWWARRDPATESPPPSPAKLKSP